VLLRVGGDSTTAWMLDVPSIRKMGCEMSAFEQRSPLGNDDQPPVRPGGVVRWKRFRITAVATLAAAGLAACGGSKTTTVIESNSPAVSFASTSSSPGASRPTESIAPDSGAPPRPQVFHGTGQQNLGTITLPADTTISWNCPSCANTNFIINNAKSDANAIPTNGLNQAQGVDPIPGGVYHTVVVDTTGGPWTVAVGTTATPPPTSLPGAVEASGATGVQQTSSGQAAASQCDPNVSVSQGECKFAENTFYEYWVHHGPSTFSVYSPADQTSLTVTCTAGSAISCTADQGTTVQFSQSSIDAYTQGQADSYARSHKIGP
jgi:hypothetical protein